jgi:hypothetical protein
MLILYRAGGCGVRTVKYIALRNVGVGREGKKAAVWAAWISCLWLTSDAGRLV